MSITTTSLLPAPVQQSFNEKLLAVPVPYMIHNIAATPVMMPRNGGTTLRQRRYDRLPVANVPLGNSGAPIAPTVPTYVDIDAQISFYGQWIGLNEQVTLQNQDPVLNEMAKLLGISLRETEDVLTRDLLASTASQINCTGGTNGDNPTEMTRDDIDLVVATLVDNNAYTIASVIEGEDRFGTAPVRDAFFAMASSQLIGDFEQVNGFIAKAQYPSQMSVLREEWGSISNLRFLVSSIGSVSASSSALGADVYNIFCVGMEAYQFIEQDGYSAQFIYRPPYFSDALAQNATVAWKAAMVPLISNDLWVINLRTTKAS